MSARAAARAGAASAPGRAVDAARYEVQWRRSDAEDWRYLFGPDTLERATTTREAFGGLLLLPGWPDTARTRLVKR